MSIVFADYPIYVEQYLFGCSAQDAYEWQGFSAQVEFACYMRAQIYTSLRSCGHKEAGTQ